MQCMSPGLSCTNSPVWRGLFLYIILSAIQCSDQKVFLYTFNISGNNCAVQKSIPIYIYIYIYLYINLSDKPVQIQKVFSWLFQTQMAFYRKAERFSAICTMYINSFRSKWFFRGYGKAYFNRLNLSRP
jgi:hypothetical protein